MTGKLRLSGDLKLNEALRRIEVWVDGDIAYLSYTETAGALSFDHVYVPEKLRGKGIAERLVRRAIEAVRQQHGKIIPRCDYVAAFLDRSPEFADVVEQRKTL
jgi:predicted GNAT family acetyltransferase